MDQSTKRPPLVSVMHHKQMIAFGDEIMRDEGWGPVAVDGAFLVERLFHESPVGNHRYRPVADF